MDKPTAFIISLSIIVIMKIACFIIGYLVVRLGYDLLKRGVKGEFKFSTEMSSMKVDLASVSPGLLFVLLGCIVIGYAMYVEKPIKFSEKDGLTQYETSDSSMDDLREPELDPIPNQE
jgi:hypothetical protein